MGQAAAVQTKKTPEPGSGSFGLVLQITLMSLLFLGVVWANIYFIQRPEGVTWIWVPSGMALALMVTNRRRHWPLIALAVIIADLIANLLGGSSWTAGLTFGLVTGLGAFAAASLLRRICELPPGYTSPNPARPAAVFEEFNLTFQRFANMLALFGISVVVYAGTALVSVSVMPRLVGGFGSMFLTWWVSAVLGAALVVPLAVAWREPRAGWAGAGSLLRRPARLLEGLGLTIFLAASTWLLFLSHLSVAVDSVLPAYVIFPFLIWAAVRFDQRYVTTALALICLAAMVGGRNDLGIFTDPQTAQNYSVPSVQLYLLMLTVTTLTLNAVQVELKMTTKAVTISEAEHRALVQNATIGIFHSLPWGGYLDANPSLAGMLGYASAAELMAQVTNIPGQLYVDRQEYEQVGQASLHQDGWNHSVVRYKRKDGSQMIGRLSVRKVLSADGQTYLEGFVEDITERLRVEDALRTNEQVMKLFVENAPAAIAMFDREMHYMVTSKRYRQDYDLSGQILTGRTIFEVFPGIAARWQELYRRCLAGEVLKSEEGRCVHPDGRQDLVRWEMRPWYHTEKEIGGVILLSEVITERRTAEQALKKSEALLNETQAIARVGGWEYDLASKQMTWTQEVYRIYAVAPDFDTNDLNRNFKFYALEDRHAIQQAFKKAIEPGEPFDLELRFVDAARRHLWVRTRGTAVVEDGRVVRVNGTIMDISERKRAEGALVRSEEQLRLAMEASNDGMWDWRPQKNMQYYSPAYYRMLNYTEAEFPSDLLAWMEFIHPDDQTIVRRTIEACRADLLPSFEIEFRLKAKQGGWKWILSRGKTVSRDAAGRPVRVVGTTVDITERKMVEEALRRANRKLERQAEANDRMQILLIEQATHDALTGLYNRRFLDDALQREILRANREGYPVSILMLDIDHFKMFNDSYGHEAGDQVLVALSSLLRVNIRQSDIACRYGGEEFVVIMPKASGADARHRAERICEDFSNIRIGPEGLSATISMGLAVYPQHGASVDELLRSADSALYLAKGAGRNCVRIWTN